MAKVTVREKIAPYIEQGMSVKEVNRMSRLTERYKEKVFCKADCSEMIDYAEDCECPHLQKMKEKLAHYEELEEQMEKILSVHHTMRDFVCACVEYYELSKTKPEISDAMLISHADSKKLKEYKDLEEQGLLLKLPCKVGEKVYHIAFNYKTTRKEKIVETIFSLEMLEDYKKWWFLTKAEAEKALAEMEK